MAGGTAASGNVGEHSSSAIGFTNVPTSTQWGDLVSITLSAGDWDLTAIIDGRLSTGSALGFFEFGISSTSGNSATGLFQR